jgi:hypothetical protein
MDEIMAANLPDDVASAFEDFQNDLAPLFAHWWAN